MAKLMSYHDLVDKALKSQKKLENGIVDGDEYSRALLKVLLQIDTLRQELQELKAAK